MSLRLTYFILGLWLALWVEIGRAQTNMVPSPVPLNPMRAPALTPKQAALKPGASLGTSTRGQMKNGQYSNIVLTVNPPSPVTAIESAVLGSSPVKFSFMVNVTTTNLVTVHIAGANNQGYRSYRVVQGVAVVVKPMPGADNTRIYIENPPGLFVPVLDMGTNSTGTALVTNPPAQFRVAATSVSNGAESDFSDVVTTNQQPQTITIKGQ